MDDAATPPAMAATTTPHTGNDDTDKAALRRVVDHVRDAMQAHCALDSDRQQRLPFVTLTYAQSIDGSIAAVRGAPTLLSGAQSMHMTHVLRTMHDAILVGVGTILADNPSLNARFAEGANPTPVIVDTSLRCPLTIKLFTSPLCVKPVILCGDTSASPLLQQRREALERAGATVLECATTADAHVDIRHGLALLRSQLGLERVMIEGGAAIITACLVESAHSGHLVDIAVLTIAPVFLGGVRAVNSLLAPTMDGGRRRPSTNNPILRLQQPSLFVSLGNDLVLVGRL